MRAIQIIPGLVTESSGPSYSVQRLAQSLATYGWGCELAALRLGKSVATGGIVREFPVTLGMRRLGLSEKMRRWLFEQAQSRTTRLFHSHGLWMMPNVYPGWASGRFGIPLVVSPRGTLSGWAFHRGSWAKPLFWHLWQRGTLVRASVIHATSDDEAREIRSHGFGAPIAVIPNGIDLPPASALLQRPKRPVLAFLSRIHPKKGVDSLLRTWAFLERQHQDWTLEIAGPTSNAYAQKMIRLAEQLALRRATFIGEVTGLAKVEFLSRAALMVLPTHSENFGMVVAEALACGTPVVVTRSAPWSGLEANRAGWWIENTEDALHETLNRAMQMPTETLAEMGRSGRLWMKHDFSWGKVGAMMDQTYRWCLGESPRPSWVLT